MKINKTFFFLVAVILGVNFTIADAKLEEANLGIAQPKRSNDLDFVDSEGKLTKLSDLKGKVVILNFWATWCQPCIAELPSFQQLYTSLESEQDIVFLSIEMDQDHKKAASYFKKKKYTLPLYSLGSDLPEDFRTDSIPMTIIIAKNGEVIIKKIGMIDFASPRLKRNLIELTKERTDLSYQ